jgi:hypothetical protein
MNYETRTVVSISKEEAKTIERAITLVEDLFEECAEEDCYNFLLCIGHRQPEYYVSKEERILFKYRDDDDEE